VVQQFGKVGGGEVPRVLCRMPPPHGSIGARAHTFFRGEIAPAGREDRHPFEDAGQVIGDTVLAQVVGEQRPELEGVAVRVEDGVAQLGSDIFARCLRHFRRPPFPLHATPTPACGHQVNSLTDCTIARPRSESLPESHTMPHPFRDVAIVGVYNTVQARELPDHDSASIELEGALGALADAGLTPGDVDTVCTQFSSEDVLALGLGPCTIRGMLPRITSVLDAAALIATGQSDVVLMAAGGAGVYTDRTATAPWTRPAHEFVVGHGLFTAAEFALIARRHMLTYGTTPEQMAIVAATIRNNGHG